MKNGTKVTVSLPNASFRGEVVGRASDGIAPMYIVKCVDGYIPSEEHGYDYDTCVIPLSCLKTSLS